MFKPMMVNKWAYYGAYLADFVLWMVLFITGYVIAHHFGSIGGGVFAGAGAVLVYHVTVRHVTQFVLSLGARELTKEEQDAVEKAVVEFLEEVEEDDGC